MTKTNFKKPEPAKSLASIKQLIVPQTTVGEQKQEDIEVNAEKKNENYDEDIYCDG